jgi:ArsR family transcriptional regulator
MDNLTRWFYALGDETRWRIIQLIFTEALCVCEIAEILDMPQSSVSSHLQVLRKAGLLESERCEKWIYYRLAGQFQSILGKLAEQFEGTPGRHPVLTRDARRAAKRLARRIETCCPGPKQLASVSTKKNP